MSFKQFFLSTGNHSLMRLCVFIVICTGCFLAIILSILDMLRNQCANLTNISLFVGAILAIGFGGKVVQKKNEVLYEADSTPEQN